MQELQISVEEETYIALVRLCEWKRAANEGSLVYDLISSSMVQLSVALGNALLGMFMRLGSMVYAWYVFGKMGERDVFLGMCWLVGMRKVGISMKH